MQERI